MTPNSRPKKVKQKMQNRSLRDVFGTVAAAAVVSFGKDNKPLMYFNLRKLFFFFFVIFYSAALTSFYENYMLRNSSIHQSVVIAATIATINTFVTKENLTDTHPQ